jgi:hypothetical protein
MYNQNFLYDLHGYYFTLNFYILFNYVAFIAFRAFKYEIYLLFDFYPSYHLHFVVKGAGHMYTVSYTTLPLFEAEILSLSLSLFSMVHFHWNTTGLMK